MEKLFAGAILALVTVTSVRAEDSLGPNFANPRVERWRFGVRITAPSAPAMAIVASAPVPSDWPEQKVRVVEENVSDNVRRVRFRNLGDGARQMVVEISRLAAGESAEAILTFEIEKSDIEAPDDPSRFTRTPRATRDLRPYLAPSPQIESDHRAIQTIAAKVIEGRNEGWESVEAIYDWVRDKIQYREGELKGALAALRDGEGDCEELTSLFIALCRANQIPARTVWVPGHCYPEFYLTDAQGEGYWFPCQAAGDRHFGRMAETRPILQKGDNFRLPEERQPVRYARPTLQSNPRPGFAHPSIEVIQEPAS